MRRLFFLLFMILGSLAVMKSQTSYEKGKIIPSIAVSNTADETFSLYLPKSFKERKEQPIVFIYEPMGRGAVGVQPFVAASEKYGLILVCSNNSRNGPYARNFDISNNLFNHIFSHFSIKDDEMFASGFSGGSRLASAIASLTDKFSGVIGCGAGFSGLQEHVPSTQKYVYVGLCGNRDMNYAEMLQNKKFLNVIQFKSTLITYDGNHSWPPAEQIVRAFDWIYLQRTLKNKVAARSFFKTDHALLQQFLDNREFLFADEQFDRMIKDYGPALAVDSLEKKYSSFKKSKDFKKNAAALERALKMEAVLFDKLRSRFSNEFDGNNKPDFEWWKKERRKLDVLGEKENVETQKMVERVKFGLFAMAFERKMILPQKNNSAKISFLDNLIQLFYPK